MKCKVCGKPWVACDEGYGQTLVGYGSPPGHDHDDNCLTKGYYCEDGHCTSVSVIRRCSTEGCEWRGKTECGTCVGVVKYDDWPKIEKGV